MSLCSTEGGEAIPGKWQPAKQALYALKMVICIFRRNEAAFSLRASGYGSMGRSVVLSRSRGQSQSPHGRADTAGPHKYSLLRDKHLLPAFLQTFKEMLDPDVNLPMARLSHKHMGSALTPAPAGFSQLGVSWSKLFAS